MPINFDRLVLTKSALIEDAWCRRKVEWACKRSPRSSIGGLTSREEYSVVSFSSAALALVAGVFTVLGRIVKLID
jgi:hypothetical protein